MALNKPSWERMESNHKIAMKGWNTDKHEKCVEAAAPSFHFGLNCLRQGRSQQSIPGAAACSRDFWHWPLGKILPIDRREEISWSPRISEPERNSPAAVCLSSIRRRTETCSSIRLASFERYNLVCHRTRIRRQNL
jgi:hypothetical protein